MNTKYIVLFSLIFIALFSFVQCKSDKNEKTDNTKIANLNVVNVKTCPIIQEDRQQTIDVLGVVLSETEARPAFKTGGVINKVYVSEGQYVKKGQLIATLLMNEIDAQVRQAEEGLSKAERDVKRVKNLYADSVATTEQLQNVTTAFEVAKKTVEIAKFNRNFSEVRSPINGRVVKQIMHDGEIVGPGNPVCGIMGVGNADWKINAGLVDKDWARVKKGDAVTVRMDAYPTQTFNGKITDKTSIGGNASGTFDIEVKLNQNPANLAAGLITKLVIHPTTTEKMTTIPIEALVKSNGNYADAFTIVDGKAKKLHLTISKLLGDKVAIIHGLEGVDKIITTGAMYLEEGDLVKE
ncbi:MAG: efflux RND transporter periplasmic adaptor subunit [Saprospiraceae bacterium]|nr:efflux RND transporter periplasmic adaptor subunit [Saprospiraceae bacterium]